MSSRKRKRYSRDIKYVFFPDDVENGPQKLGKDATSISLVSSVKSWEKCGDSFLDTPVIKDLHSQKNLSAVRKLAQSPALEQRGASRSNEDAVHITWSSSDTEQSDDENQEQLQSKIVSQKPRCSQRPGKTTAPIQRHTSMLSTDKDDLPVIDTDSDLDGSEEDLEKYNGQQISDCESGCTDEKRKDFPLKHENVKEQEISGYGSDGEDIGISLTSSKVDSEIFHLQAGEGSTRSVSDWVKSAQAMLQTPQKSIDRHPKTPEDSAKKKRKLQSGGLAERLNRLQCRQRSAISFWRHKSICNTSTAVTTPVDRPGVLVLEVLEVHEECSMQLAHCEHHQPPGDDLQHSNPEFKESARMLVLFNRETAAQLSPAPRDIIHIYPPWQSLSIDDFSCPVILNTNFSQKVCSVAKPGNMSVPKVWLSARKCMPYHLGKIFGLLDECWTTKEGKQAAASDALCSFGESGVVTRSCVSLLEAIEGLGQAGIVERDVEVVVQRVYSIPIADCSPVSIKHGVPLRSSTQPLPVEKGKIRLCVLVQDGYGMFSVVQFHVMPNSDELCLYCHMWQGKNCVLRGIRVVKRVTRVRHSRLFSLIDSLWPPATPLKDHGNSLSFPIESRPPGPAPSFCYLLSGQQTSVQPIVGQNVSLLYLHPTNQTLLDIIQSEMKTCRCSFVATVLYKRMQSSDVGQGQVWLVLTDPSLQEEQPERPCKRTVALCVNTSCALTSSVLEALNSPAICCMSFRDAIREHGVLLCAEQTVVEVCSVGPQGTVQSTSRPDAPSQSLTVPQVETLPWPVRLDPLSLETTPNSLCTLTGVIAGVDENTAYCWPACSICGSDNLEMADEKLQRFHCVSCKSLVDKPETKFQLEVFLSSSSLSSCTVKVKLQQKTIMSILNITALETNEFQGYDVESVLGKEVGPIAVYVRVVSRKPALWFGLEEICLYLS